MNAIEAVVQERLEAYNARDLVRSLAVYSDDVRMIRLPATEPVVLGDPNDSPTPSACSTS